MIYVGSNRYLVHCGSNRYYIAEPLPSDYIEVGWIAANKDSYIDTGVIPNAAYSLDIVAKYYDYPSDGYSKLFGSMNDGQTNATRYGWFAMEDKNNLTAYQYAKSKGKTYTADTINNSISRDTRALNWHRYAIHKDNVTSTSSVAIYDNTVVGNFPAIVDTTEFYATLYLLALNAGGTPSSTYAHYYIKSCKIWDENRTQIRDYIPVYKISTGKYGLWDKCTRTFVTSANANDLIGDTITVNPITLPSGYTQVDYIRFTGAQWITVTEEVKPTDCYDVEWRWRSSTVQQRVFSTKNSDYGYVLYINGSSQMAFNYGSVAIWHSMGASHAKDMGYSHVIFDGKNELLTINSHCATSTFDLSSYTKLDSTNDWYIGRSNTTASERRANMDLLSFKKYDNGTLIHNFIPCKNSNDVYGLYDIVGEAFYSSGSSTPLQGGYIKD